jgi:large subunit ribosomal protein L29
MKANDFRNMSVSEVSEKVDGLEEELLNLRFQAQVGQLSNPLRMRLVRRDIARARTVLNENKSKG